MKTNKNFLKKLTAGILGFVMTLGVGAAGFASNPILTKAAENDQHDINFAEKGTGILLNNKAAPSTIEIDDPGYPIKQVIINWKHNKSNEGITANVTVGETSLGSGKVGGTSTTTDTTIGSGNDVLTGDVKISFTNNMSGTGKGTLYLYHIYLVEAASGSVSVDGVSLNKTTTSIEVGEEETLTATVSPANASDKSVSWTSTSESVATVSSSGLVKGISKGSSTITATTTDGGFSASCTVNVTEPVVLTSVQSISGSLSANVGGTWNTSNIKVVGLMSDGSTPDITSNCNIVVNTSVPSTASSGNASVTATSKTSSSITKTVTDIPYTVILEHGTTPEDPFTIDEAKAKINSSGSLSTSKTYYVLGYFVKNAFDYSSSNNTMSVWLSASSTGSTQDFELYKMNIGADPKFTAHEEIIAYTTGDKFQKYSSTYELNICEFYNKPYAVTFNGNGADSSWLNPQINQTWLENYSLPTSNPTKEGYTFKGWYTQSSGGTKVESTTKAPRTGVSSLYAQWDIKTYTVSYAPGNFSTGSNYSETKTHDVNLTLKNSTYLRTGYKQTGWSVNADGSTNDYGLGATYSTNSALSLYPYWSAKGVIELTADNLSIDLHEDVLSGVAPLNPSVSSGVTYSVVNTSVAKYENGKFYPVSEGTTTVNMTKSEDTDYVYKTGSFTIEVTSKAKKFNVTITKTECTVTGSSEIYENTEESYSIIASTNYKLPTSIDVTGATVKSYTPNENRSSATLVIHEATADVSFTVAANPIETFAISYSGSNYNHTNVVEITEFTSEQITLTATGDYKLPNTVTVDGATQESYSSSTGILKIKNPTGKVTITCNPVALTEYTITVEGSGTYSDKYTYSGSNKILESRSATVTILPAAVEEGDPGHYEISNITVTGATKGSYIDGSLSLSNPTNNVTITVTPVYKVIQSIRVTKNPDKMEYIIGEAFEDTGIKVTGYYDTNATQSAGDITNECTISLTDPEAMLKAGTPVVNVVHNPTNVSLDDSHQLKITVKAKQISTVDTFTKVNFGEGRFLIGTIGNNGKHYYLSTASKAIVEYSVDSDGLPLISSSVDKSSYLWNVTYNSSNSNYTIKNDSGSYLYGTTAADGIKVGDKSGTWTYNATNNSLKNDNNRYLGIYHASNGSGAPTDWRSYDSDTHQNYSGSAKKLEFFSVTSVPSGSAKLVALTASYIRETPHYIGENALKSDFAVKAWYDDGTVKTSTSVDNPFEDFTIVNPLLTSENNEIELSYTDSITKTCSVSVPAIQIVKEVRDVWIETEKGYQTQYIKYENQTLNWNLDHIKAKIYWNDETTSTINISDLTDLVLNPALPSVGDEGFTVSGTYMGISVNSEHNAVTGITVANFAPSSITMNFKTVGGNVNPRVNYWQDEKFDYDATLASIRVDYNDGTHETQSISFFNGAKLGLYKYSNSSSEPNPALYTIDDPSNFTMLPEYNNLYLGVEYNGVKTVPSTCQMRVCGNLNEISKIDGAPLQKNSDLTFTSSCGGYGTASDGAEYSIDSDGSESTFDSTKGIHYGTGKASVKYIKATTSDIASVSGRTIKKITVNASTASNIDATVSVKIGGEVFGGDPQSLSSSATDYEFNGSAIGEVEVLITKSASSTGALYLKSIIIEYEQVNKTIYSNKSFEGQYAAINYANWFIENVKSDPTDAKWNQAINKYSELVTSKVTGDDLDNANNLFKYATANASGDILQQCVAVYDAYIAKYNYGGDSSKNFLNRSVEGTKYTITLNPNGEGATCDTPSIQLANNTKYGTLPTPTRPGFEFAGWYTASSDGSGTKIESTSVFSSAKDITLHAHWTKLSNVTLVAGEGATGGALSATTYTKQDSVQTITVTADPVKEGYTLTGYTISGGSATFDFDSRTITISANSYADITLTAKWSKNSYTVTFKTDDETTWKAPTLYYGDEIDLSSSTYKPTKTGYTLDGWVDQNGKKYSLTDKIAVSENLTLTAVWKANTYTVTLNVHDGDPLDKDTITVTYGQAYGELPTPTKDHYRFDGWWTTSGDTGNRVDSDDIYELTKDSILHAHWTYVYDVEFNYNAEDASGGVLTATTYAVNKDSDQTIKITEDPVREGYTVDSYTVTVQGKQLEITNNVITIPAGTGGKITIKVNWIGEEHSVTLNYNNGSSADEIDVRYGDSFDLSEHAPVKQDYYLTGWVDSNGNSYKVDEVIDIKGDLELTAQWKNIAVSLESDIGFQFTGMDVTKFEFIFTGSYESGSVTEYGFLISTNADTLNTCIGDNELSGTGIISFVCEDGEAECVAGVKLEKTGITYYVTFYFVDASGNHYSEVLEISIDGYLTSDRFDINSIDDPYAKIAIQVYIANLDK